jgi:hypothetical protein
MIAPKDQPGLRFIGPGIVIDEPILGVPRLEILRHAQDRMKERGISLQDVRLTIEKLDEMVACEQPGRKRARRHKTTRIDIDVVYEKLKDRVLVITAIKVERRIAKR